MTSASVELFVLYGRVSQARKKAFGIVFADEGWEMFGDLSCRLELERIATREDHRFAIKVIVLTFVDGKVEIGVLGDLAGNLTLSVQTKKPAAGRL